MVIYIYIDPRVDVCSFNVLLSDMLDINHYVFLICDFNVDLFHMTETSGAMEEFKNILCSHHLYPLMNKPTWLQTTQPTSGVAVTVVSNCCANCVEPPRPQQWGPDLPFLGMPVMRTRWMAGAAAHKSG